MRLSLLLLHSLVQQTKHLRRWLSLRVLRLWGRKVFTKREPRKMTSAGMSAPWGETKRWGGGDNQSRGSHSALYRGTWRDGKVYLL